MREAAGGARMRRGRGRAGACSGQPYAEVGLVQRDLVRCHLAAVVQQHRVRVLAGLPDHKVLKRADNRPQNPSLSVSMPAKRLRK